MKLRRSMAAMLVLIGTAAQAETSVNEEIECPIGKQKFAHHTTLSTNSWGTRPDGKPYSSSIFPIGLPVCPDNGLVIFDELSAQQIERLEPLVASQQYQQMTKADTPYYRAYWLLRELGEPRAKFTSFLLQASWEADANQPVKTRYQREYIEVAAQEPKPVAGDDLDWLVLQGRRANALRELGRYDEALAVLDALSLESLDVPVPKERANYEQIRAAKARRYWLEYFTTLRRVIARREAGSEPIDMIPSDEAASVCMRSPDLSKPEYKRVCESAEVVELLEQSRRYEESQGSVFQMISK